MPDGLTIDRKDGNGDYAPENCVWASWKDQALHRRLKRSDPNSLRQRAAAAGLAYHMVYQRVKILGWDEAEALGTARLDNRQRPGRIAAAG